MNVDGDLLGDLATWVGSVGTVAAFVVAFLQIRRERVERKRRDMREWFDAKRAHADKVSGWRTRDHVVVSNQSHHPIYDVALTLPDGTVLNLDHVAPGKTDLPAQSGEAGRLTRLEFTDSRGDRWSQRPGHVAELVD